MNNLIINSPYGYYRAGNQVYLNKAEATYNASKNQVPLTWHFYEDIFNTLDWTKRPSGTLQELYKIRAQQIRDEYDHVIVNFSGGMDSWNVLYSFLSNDIHVDEIVTSWPRAERKLRPLSNSIEQWNMGSEYEFAVRPLLKEIEKKYPKINIVLYDFSDKIEQEIQEKNFFGQHNYQNAPGFHKFAGRTEKELQAIKENKKVAVVIGAEKITLTVKNNNFYAFFSDHANNADAEGRTTEFFYWSDKLPLLPVLQSHCLKDVITQEYLADPTFVPFNGNQYREIYRKACYPEYNPNTFQTLKKFGTMMWDSDLWIKEYNPRYHESWKWIVDQYFGGIDKSYQFHNKDNKLTGLTLLEGPHYLLEENTQVPNFKL